MKYRYRSKLERNVAAWLKKAGVSFQYEAYKYEYDFPISGGWCPACSNTHVVKARTYLTDFTFPNTAWVLEAKGRLSSQERSKFLCLKEAGVEVRFVFQRDNKLYPKSKTRYSTWCNQHGFAYSMGLPDTRWFL